MEIRDRELVTKTFDPLPPGASHMGPPEPGQGEQDLYDRKVEPPYRPDGDQRTPFPSPYAQEARRALEEFLEARPSTAVLHVPTDLPACLHGPLQDPSGGDRREAAQAFLQENELMVAGLKGETRLALTYESRWTDDTYHVRYEQTNDEGVPLYGTGVTCSFTPRPLTLLTSTLHPALPDQIDGLEWPETWRDWEEKLPSIPLFAHTQVDEIVPIGFRSPPNLRPESLERGWPVDRWVLAYAPPGGGEGVYRPVWRVVLLDQRGGSWLALIDAETLQVLQYGSTWVRAKKTVDAFQCAQDALYNHPLPVTLDYGWGRTKMEYAQHVHIANPHAPGSAFVEPDDAAQPPARRHLSATVFHHLRLIQEDFTPQHVGLFGLGSWWPFGFDPFGGINVSLLDASGDASYDAYSNTIVVKQGMSSGTPIEPPGFDCEVIYHEFAHAVARYFNEPVFPHSGAPDATRELDEGLAFFFACAFAGDSQWADSAYRAADWAASHDLSNDPVVQPSYTGSPAHAGGLEWAGAFWEIRQAVGALATNQMLIEAVDGLSGSFYTPACLEWRW